MNIKKVISASIIAIFIAPSLNAGPCINCVATAFKQNNTDQKSRSKWSNNQTTIVESQQKNSPSNDYIDSMIPLDDNEYDSEIATVTNEDTNKPYDENDIILTYDDSSQIEELAKTLYACEDIINNIVACDDEDKGECECV